MKALVIAAAIGVSAAQAATPTYECSYRTYADDKLGDKVVLGTLKDMNEGGDLFVHGLPARAADGGVYVTEFYVGKENLFMHTFIDKDGGHRSGVDATAPSSVDWLTLEIPSKQDGAPTVRVKCEKNNNGS